MSESYTAQHFKRSTLLYTIGRLLNALISFVVFLWIARYLPETHYAYYIAAFACLEAGLVICGFGMEWVTAVYIPQVRLKSTSSRLSRFVWTCAFVQFGLILLGGIVYFTFSGVLADWLDLDGAVNVFRLYAVVMCIEGASRVLRDQLLACLLLQGSSQSSQLVRNLCMLAFALSLPGNPDWRTASSLALVEIVGSSLSFGMAALLLQRQLATWQKGNAEEANWKPPPWRVLLRTGRNAWLSNLANLSWSGQAVILIATRLIGSDATAVLGFTRNLAEQIRRYLPMEFLLGLMRSLLIARYAQEGDQNALGLRAGIMFRMNLLFLIPLLALAACCGDQLCATLSNGRYASGQWLLMGWLVVLMFWAHHRLSDLLAHAVGRSDLSSRSSILLLPAPILVALAAQSQAWLAMFSVLAGAELLYSVLVLRSIDFYTPNWLALIKQAVGGLTAIAVLSLPFLHFGGAAALLIQMLLAYAVVTGFAAASRAWNREERELFYAEFRLRHSI